MKTSGTDNKLDDLMGPADIANYLGVSRPVVSNWTLRGKMPAPATYVGGTPAFWLHEILNAEPWLRKDRFDALINPEVVLDIDNPTNIKENQS